MKVIPTTFFLVQLKRQIKRTTQKETTLSQGKSVSI